MHKHNLGLESDCTWGVPDLQEVVRTEPTKPTKPVQNRKHLKQSCVVKDPVSIMYWVSFFIRLGRSGSIDH